jgi:hypothetical protein
LRELRKQNEKTRNFVKITKTWQQIIMFWI